MRMIFNIPRIIAAAALTAVLTGCDLQPLLSSAEPETNDVSIAVINGSNSNSVPVDIKNDIKPLISEAVNGYGHFSYIIADGDPWVVYSENMEKYTDHPSKQTIIRRVNTRTNKIMEEISSARPLTNEIDILEAIRTAKKDIFPYKNPRIIIYTTGISTYGIDMTTLKSIENIEVDSTVQSLKADGAIPDMENIKIEFRFLAADNKQAPLTNHAETVIVTLWEEIVKAGGGEFSYSYYINDSPQNIDYDTYVTPVNVSDNHKNIIEYSVDDIPEEVFETAAAEQEDFQITITEQEVEFFPDTAEIKDAQAAKEKLTGLAESLKKHNIDILLVGSTASVGNFDSSVILSEQRCMAICSILQEMGVKTTMKIKGYGYSDDNPFKIKDIYENVLVEEYAAKNRKVVIVPLNSETARTITMTD